MKKIKVNLFNITIVSLLVMTFLAVAANIFMNSTTLKAKFFSNSPEKPSEQAFTGSEKDRIWAKKVLDGGYIIFIRHAQRAKNFKGSGLFETLEVHVHGNKETLEFNGENSYYSEALCLNKQGKIQAKAMGELIKEIDFPIGTIISSPVCRARQTAEIMFDSYDNLDPILVYSGINYETSDDRFSSLRNFFKNIPLEDNKNTVITAHGNVIVPGLFENPTSRNITDIDEGGIIVLSRDGEDIIIEHTFLTFNTLIRPFFVRK
jgi:phosphohistidine phosphatase SixA